MFLKSLPSSRRFNLRSVTAAAMIIFGVALLLYVGSQYGEMFMEQHRLAAEWEQAQEKSIKKSAASPTHLVSQKVNDGPVRLVIPKIDLTSFVVEGTNHHALLLGPGHMKHTAEPGEPGNAVIASHRDTFFRHIHELVKGDRIYVDRNGKRITFEVTGKKIVQPTDVSVADQTKDRELTLITCYPTYYIGPAPKRLVVSAKMVGEKRETFDEADNSKQVTKVQAIAAEATR